MPSDSGQIVYNCDIAGNVEHGDERVKEIAGSTPAFAKSWGRNLTQPLRVLSLADRSKKRGGRVFDRLDKMLGLVQADYADLRYELVRETSIDFSGRELTGLSASSTDGYVWRVLKNGGWSAVAFTKLEDAERAARSAVENAELLARGGTRPVRLSPTPSVQDEYRPALKEDPRAVSTETKLDLTRRYNDIALDHPKVATTHTGYYDVSRDKFFVSTEGARLREELVTVQLAGAIIAKEGNLTQRVRFGGSDGLARLRGREAEMAERVKICVDLLGAEPVKGGEYRAVLDQSLAGVFAHEAFGHFSEADNIEDLPTMREKMALGAQLGSEVLSITDDPTRRGQLGFYRYDDEGVEARPVALMKDGVLTGRLHSRRTMSHVSSSDPTSANTFSPCRCASSLAACATSHLSFGARDMTETLREFRIVSQAFHSPL